MARFRLPPRLCELCASTAHGFAKGCLEAREPVPTGGHVWVVANRTSFPRSAFCVRMSTPGQNLTIPPVENLTGRRGDEPQFVATS